MSDTISAQIQLVFAAVLVLVGTYFVWNSFVVPSITSYGNEQAQMAAKSVSTAINGLSREESGSFHRELGLSWDIRVYHEDKDAYIEVSHDKFTSGDILLVNDAADFGAKGITSVTVIKEAGKIPVLQSSRTIPGGGT